MPVWNGGQAPLRGETARAQRVQPTKRGKQAAHGAASASSWPILAAGVSATGQSDSPRALRALDPDPTRMSATHYRSTLSVRFYRTTPGANRRDHLEPFRGIAAPYNPPMSRQLTNQLSTCQDSTDLTCGCQGLLAPPLAHDGVIRT